MPSLPETSPPRVDSGHVAALRDRGPGSLLVAEPDRILVLDPGIIPDHDQMVIAGHRALDHLAQPTWARDGDEREQLADALNALSYQASRDWPELQSESQLRRVREQMYARRLYLEGPPIPQGRTGPQLRVIEYFRRPHAALGVWLTFDRAFTGPTRIEAVDTDGTCRWGMHLELDSYQPCLVPEVLARTASALVTVLDR